MNKEQRAVAQWMEKAGQKGPDRPEMPDYETRRLRAKLILEEAFETIEKGLGIAIRNQHYDQICFNDLMFSDSEDLLGSNITELADGLADLQYVTLGTAVACGIDLEPCFNEVCRSNNSKWWKSEEIDTPAFKADYTFERLSGGLLCVKNASGKVIKSPSYSPANLAPILSPRPSVMDSITDRVIASGCYDAELKEEGK